MQIECEANAKGATEKRAQGGGTMVCLWKDEFLALQTLQRAQARSPRFDLRDLASAAIQLALQLPDAAARIRDQALRDSFHRHTGGSTRADAAASERAASQANDVSVAT